MEELISVVIPVYNVEKYLDRCVESVVSQSYQNLEIILVDDGSPDNCPRMCDEWAAKDARIRVIHKKNAGLGMARNTGIQNATGTYICFFDSDDYVASDIIKNAYELARNTDAEVTFFGMAAVDAEGRVTSERIPSAEQTVYTGDEVRQIVLPDLIHDGSKEARIHNLSLSVCSCLFDLALICRTNWHFVSERDIISEDSYSLLALFRDVSTVAILPQAGYYYCYNQSSLTHTYRPDRYEKICRFYWEAVRLQQRLGYPELVRERIGRLFLAFVVGALKQMAASKEPLHIRLRNVKKTVHEQTLQDVVHHLDIGCYPWKIKILFWLMRNKLCCAVYLLARVQAQANRET